VTLLTVSLSTVSRQTLDLVIEGGVRGEHEGRQAQTASTACSLLVPAPREYSRACTSSPVIIA